MPTTGTITQVIGSTFDAQFPKARCRKSNAVTIQAQTR
jgi:hypothetical protein